MRAATVIEIIVIVGLAIALVIYLMRRNVKDEENTNPDLTKALEDAKKDEQNNH